MSEYRQSISPHEFDDERVAGLTDFRCERCMSRYPLTLLKIQDGIRLCRVNCATRLSPDETTLEDAAAYGEAAELSAGEKHEIAERYALAPVWSLMQNVSAIESISTVASGAYPNPILLVHGGAAVAVTFTGVNFQTIDALTFSNAGITGSSLVRVGTPDPQDSTVTLYLSCTSNVSASGAVSPGYYDLLFNNNRFRDAIRVT